MKLRKSDIYLMLEVISDYYNHFEREDNPSWYDKVEGLYQRLDNIYKNKSKNTQNISNNNS